jgi:hypothetical protein
MAIPSRRQGATSRSGGSRRTGAGRLRWTRVRMSQRGLANAASCRGRGIEGEGGTSRRLIEGSAVRGDWFRRIIRKVGVAEWELLTR